MRYAGDVKKGKKQHAYEKLNDKSAKLVDQLSQVHGDLNLESENLYEKESASDDEVIESLISGDATQEDKEAAVKLINHLREELYHMRGERDDFRTHMVMGLKSWADF